MNAEEARKIAAAAGFSVEEHIFKVLVGTADDESSIAASMDPENNVGFLLAPCYMILQARAFLTAIYGTPARRIVSISTPVAPPDRSSRCEN